jgi:hypothetical protein
MSAEESGKKVVHSANDVVVVPHRSRPFTTMVFGAVERLILLGFRRQLNQVSQQESLQNVSANNLFYFIFCIFHFSFFNFSFFFFFFFFLL